MPLVGNYIGLLLFTKINRSMFKMLYFSKLYHSPINLTQKNIPDGLAQKINIHFNMSVFTKKLKSTNTYCFLFFFCAKTLTKNWVVVHNFNSSTCKAELLEFNSNNMVCKMSSRTVNIVTQRNPDKKNQKIKTKQNGEGERGLFDLEVIVQHQVKRNLELRQ